MRIPALLVVISLLGCSPKGAAIAGGTTFVVGLAVYSSDDDGCGGNQIFCITNQDVGGMLMISGAIVLLGGFVTYLARGPAPDNAPPPNAPPAPFAVNEPPPGDYGQIYSGQPPPPPVPDPVPAQEPRLPAAQLVYEDPQQREHAFAASAAAARGDCAAAIASGKQLWVELERGLRRVDAAYARCFAQ